MKKDNKQKPPFKYATVLKTLGFSLPDSDQNPSSNKKVLDWEDKSGRKFRSTRIDD